MKLCGVPSCWGVKFKIGRHVAQIGRLGNNPIGFQVSLALSRAMNGEPHVSAKTGNS